MFIPFLMALMGVMLFGGFINFFIGANKWANQVTKDWFKILHD